MTMGALPMAIGPRGPLITRVAKQGPVFLRRLARPA